MLRKNVFNTLVAAILLGSSIIAQGQTDNTSSGANAQASGAASDNNAGDQGNTGDQGNGGNQGGELQTMTVTGSLIPRVGEGPQPVVSYGQEYIQKTAHASISDILQDLPGAVDNFNPGQTTGFGFSPGAASIALKGLPPNDTLVLVDNFRMPASPFAQQSIQGAFAFTDLNSIAPAGIDRFEILQDGGSATYGTDAVAGVVNVLMTHDYEGADITNYFGISQRGDYETYQGSILAGFTQKFSDTSKLNVTTAIDYYTQGPIMQQDRAFTQQNFSVYSPNYLQHPANPPYLGMFSTPDGTVHQVKPGVNGTTWGSITQSNFSPTTVNGYDDQYMQLEPRESRLQAMVNFDYDVTSYLKLFDSFLISRNEETGSYPSQAIYGPSPLNSGGVVVPANNPYNPFKQQLNVQGLALNEFGPLQEDATITTFRNVAGFILQLPHDWFIKGSILYGESDGTYQQKNMFTVSGLNQALNGTLPGHVGQYFNPFVDESLPLGANRGFYGAKGLGANIFMDSRTDIFSANLTTGGTLINLPAGPLTIAGGYEYRSESLIQNEDYNSKIGNVAGYQNPVGQLINGRRHINSFFWEVDTPILGDKWSFPGAKLLDFVYSERLDDYSDFGQAVKPKFSLRYKPTDDLTVRLGYSEGFVAPSLPQLFASPLPAETTVADPLHPGGTPIINTTNGNPLLKPVDSYGYDLSIDWKPGSSDPEHSWWGWANGLDLHADLFQVDLHNLIGLLTPQEVVDMVASGATPPPGNHVVRPSPGGPITQVVNTYENLGNQRIDGIEFGFTYDTKEFNWGKLSLDFDASYIFNISQKQVVGVDPAGAFLYDVLDYTDAYGTPDFKMLASIFYSKTVFGIDTIKTGVTMHYTDSEADDNNSKHGTDPNFQSDVPGTDYVHLIGSWTTFDWQISYAFGKPTPPVSEAPQPGYGKDGKRIVGEQAVSPVNAGASGGIRQWLANTTVTFGINNVFDARPAFSSDWYQGFDPNVANYIQRYYFVKVEKKF
jgi:iron complex outermembrane recepter protein